MKLYEIGITIYGRDQARSIRAPAARLADLMVDAFKTHPELRKYISLELTIQGPRDLELSFLETEKQRRKGHGGAVMDLLIKGADALNVTLKLHAYYSKAIGNRRVLQQDQLEAFYQRRGFEIIDNTDRDRWMIRHPHGQPSDRIIKESQIDNAHEPAFVEHLPNAVEAAQVGFYFEEGGCWGMALALYGQFRALRYPAKLAVVYTGNRPSHAVIESNGKLYDYTGDASEYRQSTIRYVSPKKFLQVAELAGYNEGEVSEAKSEAEDIIQNAIEAAQ